MVKRGPKTESGKEIVRLNAVKHGVLSTSPVIPGLERREDWETHRAELLEDLAAEGRLESELSERVVLLLWRLRRVARYELETITLAQETIANTPYSWWDHLEHIIEEDLDPRLQAALSHHAALGRILKAPKGGRVSSKDAQLALESVAGEAAVELGEISLPGIPDDLWPEEFKGWTARQLYSAGEAIAAAGQWEEAPPDAGEILEMAQTQAAADVSRLEQMVNERDREADRASRQSLLPDGTTVDKIMRYEAHLHRQLLQTLHEFEAIQRRRLGEATPLARVDVQGLPEN